MNKYAITTFLILAGALLTVLSDAPRASAQSAEATTSSGQKWEYRALRITDRRQGNTSGSQARGSSSEAKLNELGDQGWELVSVRGDVTGNEPVFYFKRPRK